MRVAAVASSSAYSVGFARIVDDGSRFGMDVVFALDSGAVLFTAPTDRLGPVSVVEDGFVSIDWNGDSGSTSTIRLRSWAGRVLLESEMATPTVPVLRATHVSADLVLVQGEATSAVYRIGAESASLVTTLSHPSDLDPVTPIIGEDLAWILVGIADDNHLVVENESGDRVIVDESVARFEVVHHGPPANPIQLLINHLPPRGSSIYNLLIDEAVPRAEQIIHFDGELVVASERAVSRTAQLDSRLLLLEKGDPFDGRLVVVSLLGREAQYLEWDGIPDHAKWPSFQPGTSIGALLVAGSDGYGYTLEARLARCAL